MISASVVLYHTKQEDLDKVIASFAPSKDRFLFLVDNGEERQDQLGDAEYIEYIFMNENAGYGKAHNVAIEKAIAMGSTYHVVLNPDIRFEPSVLDELAAYGDAHPDVVYILPKVVYPDGSLQYLCKLLPTPSDLIFRRFFPKKGYFARKNDTYILKNSGYSYIMNPPCLSGCFMFMRTETLQKKKIRFDDRFFMYCEDFDLIRRLHREGKTIFYPDCTIIHDHAQESYKSKKMLKIHMQSAIKYFNKYGWFFDPERKQMNQKILSEIARHEK